MNPQDAGWLAAQLPEALSSQAFVRNFLGIFEDVTGGVRERIAGVAHHVDVDLAPAEDLNWLASWLAQDVEGLPPARKRRVIAVVGEELPWRGTARWLRRLLTAYTGTEVEVTDTGGVHLPDGWRPRRPIVTVRMADTGGLSDRQLDRLIRRELPVDAELDLQLPEDRPPPPRPRPGPPPGPPTSGDDLLEPEGPPPDEPAEPEEPNDDPGAVDEDGEVWLPPHRGPDVQQTDDRWFTVELECEAFTVTRDQPLRCWLYLHNRADRPDEFTVIGVDTAGDWVADSPIVVPMAADQERQLPIGIVVPGDAHVEPGTYSIGLQVTSALPGAWPETRRMIVTFVEE
jgi:phage tail-like protein